MVFPFPEIAGDCPLCGTACGAIYRGYYRRWAVVPEAPYRSWVAIRTAFCRLRGVRFALMPEFLVTYRAFSRQALVWCAVAWRKGPGELVRAADRWFEDAKSEVYLSVSTLYANLRFVVREFRLGGGRFGLPGFSGRTLWELHFLAPALIEAAINHPAFGLGASARIEPPP